MDKTLRVTIFGRHYPLRVTDETEELTRRVAALVEDRMERMAAEMHGQPEIAIATLTAMELAEELLLATDSSSTPPDVTRELDSLTQTLEAALLQTPGDGMSGKLPINDAPDEGTADDL